MLLQVARSGASRASRAAPKLPMSGVPSSKRSVATVVNRDGRMNLGADNINLRPVELYHSPAAAQGLAQGQLEAQSVGALPDRGTPARYQPSAFGSGAPQVTPSMPAATLYGGWQNPLPGLRVYEIFANPYAVEQIQAAISRRESNEYVIYVPEAMGFSSANARALGGNDRRALQFTPRALESQEFVVQYREAEQDAVSELFAQMQETARGLPADGGAVRETPGSANSALNALMRRTETIE